VRSILLSAILFAAATMQAAKVTFVSPLNGAQVFGPTRLEIATDATAIDRVDFFIDGQLAGIARKAPYGITHDFGETFERRSITAKVWTAGFRDDASATITTAAMSANDTLNVDLVEVPVRVRSGQLLRPTDLRVREDGVEQTIRNLTVERPPAHFAFVVDRSLSMNDSKLEAALHAIESELRQLRAMDTASLVAFDHRVAKARPIARGEKLAMDDLRPSGGTSLRDALASVASHERTFAIVITDGGDRTSALSEEEALRKISGARTNVSAIVLGNQHTKFLDRAAQNTGGSVLSANASSVRDVLARLLSDINSRYVLIYQSKSTGRGWRTIDVQPRRTGLAIATTRKGYFAE
jgi:uncharacterized protein YegL